MGTSVKVLKFGGTSMGTAEAMRQVIEIVRKPQKDAAVRAVVVSAMNGVTNTLIKIAHEAAEHKAYKALLEEVRVRHLKAVDDLVSAKNRVKAHKEVEKMFRYLADALKGVELVRDVSPQALDYVMSYGERLSAHILTEALNDKGVPAEYLNARHVVRTDANFGSAAVDFKTTNRQIAAYFKKHKKLQVVTGFIGATEDKKTTTIGRGGSDYSGAIFGAALKAKAIEIWTDVSGVMTADPRLVKNAKVVPELAFEEAGELAYFGAKVLHPKTILPAMREGIPVKVLNTFRPKDRGTTIVADFAKRKVKSHTVDALTFKRPITIVHIHSPELFDANGLMAAIFRIFEKYRTSVDVVATSVTSVSLTIDSQQHLPQIIAELATLGRVHIEQHKAIVCAVGGGINAAGVAGKMFTALGKSDINVEMISQASSAVSITFIVHERDAEKALQLLHKEYIR
ncbi:MAG: aspartate kinase [Candidatus Kaiserbacteria bacterium]|nr:MAG: aspartate kinase [Candidatus Kaiserbacteria bacterium]